MRVLPYGPHVTTLAQPAVAYALEAPGSGSMTGIARQPPVRFLCSGSGGLRAFLCLTLLACVGSTQAQQWTTLTKKDGLAGDGVHAIHQSSDGAMWFATGGDFSASAGVNRYDGSWQTFTTADGLISELVTSIGQASDGAMWFGTVEGISQYDGTVWTTFTTADGLGSNAVWAMYESSDGAMWFATGPDSEVSEGGVSRYDGSWQTFTTADGVAGGRVTSIYQSSDGAMWFGMQPNRDASTGGVSRYDGSWQTFTTADGLAGQYVTSIYQSSDGAMWFGTRGDGVSRYDGTWQTFTTADGLAENDVLSVFESSDGVMWFGTLTGGLSRYDGTWQTFTVDDRLAGNQVNSIYQSSDGAMWFASPAATDFDVRAITGTSGGVTRYDGINWQTFTTDNGLAEGRVESVNQAADGAMWFATRGGVSRFDGTSWEKLTTAHGLTGNQVLSVYRSRDGALWFTTDNGVSRFDGTWQRFRQTPDGLADRAILSAHEASDGAMWFGTFSRGVSRYDGTDWQTFTTVHGLASDRVESVYQSRDGSMWFGTSGGVSRYDGTDWQTFTTADGLVANGVLSVYESADGAMWFGTFINGVSRYDGANWTTFTGVDGLSGNKVQAVYQSADGSMWFGTSGGVSRYDGSQWQTLTIDDGLPSNWVLSVYESSDGLMWFGTNGSGVTSFRRPPRALVQTLILRSPARLHGSDRFFFESQGFQIASPIQPPISYTLTRDTTAPREFDWSPFELASGFELTGLENGTWTYHVRAKDRYSLIDPTPATVTFTVDLTDPTVLISSPRGGDAISGQVVIQGSAFDNSEPPDLKSYVLEYAKGETQGQVSEADWLADRIQVQSPKPVISGILGTWDTVGLHGAHLLRLTAVDSLAHRTKYAVAVRIVTAVEEVDPRQGGHVADAGNSADLYIPPNGIDQSTQVTIAPVDETGLVLPNDPDVQFLGMAFDIEPADLALGKPATFVLALDGISIPEADPARLALFTYSEADGGWEPLGGTVDAGTNKITVALTQLGRLALMQNSSEDTGSLSIADLNCQPRVFYPRGGGFDLQTTVSFNLGTRTDVTVKVYDEAGRFKREIVADKPMNSGSNAEVWDGKDNDGNIVLSGVYIVTVEAGSKVKTKTVGVLNE